MDSRTVWVMNRRGGVWEKAAGCAGPMGVEEGASGPLDASHDLKKRLGANESVKRRLLPMSKACHCHDVEGKGSQSGSENEGREWLREGGSDDRR